MYPSIEIQQFVSHDLRVLSTNIRSNWQHGEQLTLPQIDAYQNHWIVFWGPAGADHDTINEFLANLPAGVPAIGASTPVSICQDQIRRDQWIALSVSSAYMTPHAAFASLDANAPRAIDDCVDRLVGGLKTPEYFRPDDEPAMRIGAHRVTYIRPAFVLLFTPGVGASISPQWPVLDKDYELVEALASRVSRSVKLFGGAAAAGWPMPTGSDVKWSWIAARDNSGSQSTMRGGLVALLVESDLAFGSACSHGFIPDWEQPIRVNGFHIDPGLQVENRPGARQSRPVRSHAVYLDPEHMSALDLLDDPAAANANIAPVLKPDRDWKTLVVCDGDDVFANPPYQWKDCLALLRPVPLGATLYRATARYDPVLKAAAQAPQDALRRGDVERPALLLFTNCRGRLRLLGEIDGPSQELACVSSKVGQNTTIVGVYTDGETCPSHKGVNLHWNWTIAALAIGADFSREYAQAARTELLGRLDRAITSPWDQPNSAPAPVLDRKSADPFAVLSPVLNELTRAATLLLQTDYCGIRIISPDKTSLQLEHGDGALFVLLPGKVDLSPLSPHRAMLAYRCWNTGKTQILSGDEYLKSVANQLPSWSEEIQSAEVIALLKKVKWWVSVPITETGEFLGVLTMNSEDSRFLGNHRSEQRVKVIAEKIVARAAVQIRACLMREAFADILVDALNAPDQDTLADIVVRGGARLLGSEVFMGLFLANESNTELRSIGFRSPKDDSPSSAIRVPLARAAPAKKGIVGWVYEHAKAYVCDRADLEANGVDGGPVYRRCFHGVTADYAIPLIDDASSTRQVLGVLNVEAPLGVLKRDTHLPIIWRIADACVGVIKQYKVRESLRRSLAAVLPPHLADKVGPGFHEFGPPSRKIVSVLFADVRNYTEMSEIIGEERMAAFLRWYYEMIAGIIGKTKGSLDKFMGDGVIALYGDFNSVDGLEDDTSRRLVIGAMERAVTAGLDISQRFQSEAGRWLAHWREECPEIGYDRKFEIGIAIHTGKPIVGLFLSGQKRADVRLSYTAIGKDVNLCQRIGSEVKRSEVWVSATTWQLLQKSALFDTSDKPIRLSLKGIAGEIHAFRVVRKGGFGATEKVA